MADQGDQVSSGSPTLPVRVSNEIEVPRRQVGAPGERAEPAHQLGVVDLGDQGAGGCVSRREPHDRPGIARSDEDRPSGRTSSERIWPLSSLAIGAVSSPRSRTS